MRAAALGAGLLAASALLFGVPAPAATIVIQNGDQPGVGFNDPKPVAPTGGNPGTTLGQQRLNGFQEAARIWGSLLASDVTIVVEATFEPLDCSESSAVLGSAGTQSFHTDFPGAPLAKTWYPQALANKLSATDRNPGAADIRARFNSRLGETGCLTGAFWYYGFDNAHGGNVDLVTVVLHEFAHGLGFATPIRGDTGKLFPEGSPDAQPDVFSRSLLDTSTNLAWPDMTDAQRIASATNTGNLVWNGPAASRWATTFLGKRPRLLVTAPVSAAGVYSVGTAAFGAPLAYPGVTGTVVLGQDGAGASPTDGCEAFTNTSLLHGSIALVDRGTCNFTVKVKNAQDAGAIAVLIADNVAGAPPAGLGGSDPSITIPSVRLTQADGARLKASLPATVDLGLDPTLLAGADTAGRMQMYTPSAFSLGSSVSHFDVSATPNLLMEPAVNGDLPRSVDATLELLGDIGWFRGSLPETSNWILPSSARLAGAGGAFFTTDLALANRGNSDAFVTVKFLGHDRDGRAGAEKKFGLGGGRSVAFADALSSLFGVDADFGAIRLSSSSAGLSVTGQTATPGAGGTFGQSVPAAGPEDLVTSGTPRSIIALREDERFRTNLVVSNATETPVDVDLTLVAEDGTALGSQRLPTLQPLEMRQVSRVIPALAGRSGIANALLILGTPTPNGAFAAYASVIDNATNDPRTLLPGPAPSTAWILPSSARVPSAGGAFYTTDLTVANRGTSTAAFTLKFLGNGRDGRTGPERSFSLTAGRAVTYADVLGSVFGAATDFGAIRVTSNSADLNVLGQTSTPGAGGTFGQSVPAAGTGSLIGALPRAIPGVREDARFRTNLIVANATQAPLDVDVLLLADNGTTMGTQRLSLAPLEMRQVTRVVSALAGSGASAALASIVLSTPTTGGAFAAYASVIDNVTNDPRTLLPR